MPAGGRRAACSSRPSILPQLERELRAGIRVARAAGVRVELVTSARNFSAGWRRVRRRGAPRPRSTFARATPSRSLSAVARRMTSCCDAWRRDEAVGLIDADRSLAADPALFGDSTHLSAAGEERLAELIYAVDARAW